MAKAIVVYESKYGNTKLVAETIIEGMNQIPEIETILNEVNDVNLTEIDKFDIIIVGSPNHLGRATRGITKFINKLGELKLENKQTSVFDTYIGNWVQDFEKVVKKMEKQISEKVSGMTLVAPGLSIKVDRTKGPITKGELPKCKEFGVKIATQMKE